ncbi:MAG: gliding motility-associated C-terminal domain-containing protein [Bacteroidales bacterium]|nr:gliding motility-associated C-terminal domain-containing protein [Bacteroidales bacterium]
MRYLVCFFVAFWLGGMPLLKAQNDPPKFHCITVNPDGSAMLRWTAPTSTTGFQRYLIYFNPASTGAFVLIDQIDNALISTYTHVDADANSGPRRYYFVAEYETVTSISSDTLSSMWLQVDNTNQAMAGLYWNAPRTPLHNGSSDTYEIWRELPVGVWSFRGSTTTTSFQDPVVVCNDSVNYRIVLPNNNACQSVSSATGARFSDIVYPDKPQLDSVSASPDGHVHLGWTASLATDTWGYIIYRFEQNTWQEVSWIYDREVTYFLDDAVDACTVSPEYAIASFDSCMNKSPGTFLNPQRPILMNQVVYNSCSLTNQLSWTSYENAAPALEGYNIYESINGSVFAWIDRVDATTLTYMQGNLSPGMYYTYKIEAFFGAGTSNSCEVSVFASEYAKPAFLNLMNVSVPEGGGVELLVDADVAATISSLIAKRSVVLPQAPFKLYSYSPVIEAPVLVTDETASTSDSAYYYSLSLTDSCGANMLETATHRTMLLKGNNASEQQNVLEWNAYEGWDVLEYRIYRKLTGQDVPQLIGTNLPGNLNFSDQISGVSAGDGVFVYVVEAVENATNPPDEALISRSNVISLTVESGLFMPNAFRPGGLNTTFGPVFRFAGFRDYSLSVFNRWGKLIFDTSDVNNGWDGRYAGELVPAGAYVYVLQYLNQYGETVTKRGAVSVVY